MSHSFFHMARPIFQKQQVPSSYTTKEHISQTLQITPLPHLRQVQSLSLRSPVAAILFWVAKCLLTATSVIPLAHKIHTWRITVFNPSHPSSKCRVPGARDHQWQRLRLSHTARPIETCGLHTAPTNEHKYSNIYISYAFKLHFLFLAHRSVCPKVPHKLHSRYLNAKTCF